MRDDKVRIEICEAQDHIYDKTGAWATFDPESYQSFFPDRCRDFTAFHQTMDSTLHAGQRTNGNIPRVTNQPESVLSAPTRSFK